MNEATTKLQDLLCRDASTDPQAQEAYIIPELRVCVGYDQKNKYHDKDLFQHTLSTMFGCESDFTTRLAALLHDIGKPLCMTVGKDGFHHYNGHGKFSASLAETILQRLGIAGKQAKEAVELIKYHDMFIEENYDDVKKLYKKLGYEQCLRLMNLRRADILAAGPLNREERLRKCRWILVTLHNIQNKRT